MKNEGEQFCQRFRMAVENRGSFVNGVDCPVKNRRKVLLRL